MLASKNRINKGPEFDRVKEEGKLYQSDDFGVAVLEKDGGEESRFGFVVSTKISKMAVHRNRVKRALREAIRQNLKYIPKGYDMVFLTKKSIMEKSTDQIMKQVESFLESSGFKK